MSTATISGDLLAAGGRLGDEVRSMLAPPSRDPWEEEWDHWGMGSKPVHCARTACFELLAAWNSATD